MIERRYILTDEMGLHARPAALLMMRLRKVFSSVEITCKGGRANAKDAMSIMALHAVAGDEVVFRIEGPDEVRVLQEVESVMKL